MPETLIPVHHIPRQRVAADRSSLLRPDDLERLLELHGLAGWITDELMKPGAVLSPTAIDDAPAAPAIGRSVITSMVRRTLLDARPLVERFLPADLRAEAALAGAGTVEHARLEQGARLITRLLGFYWEAVRAVYPEAWVDRKRHLLFSEDALTAFSRLAAVVITARVARYEIMPAGFVAALQPVAENVPLGRADRPAGTPLRAAEELFADLLVAFDGADSATGDALFPPSAPWDSPASPMSAAWGSPEVPLSAD